ncbi:hypothetical protein Msub_20629 [Marinobacter subterrani]|uniref:Uncharacterized protein n=1 Tax=Marinobacter subterrani TaxID=1658765 RepID=A0A0J7J636_9GAMM|nr:hypothetical protein Msub_20629 [Marinobacter subterrani]
MICGGNRLTLFSPEKFGRHCYKRVSLPALGPAFFEARFKKPPASYWLIMPAIAMMLSLLLTNSSNCSSTCSRFRPRSS